MTKLVIFYFKTSGLNIVFAIIKIIIINFWYETKNVSYADGDNAVAKLARERR